MPELPDIEVFTRNLNKLFSGKTLKKVIVIGGKNITDSQAIISRRLSGKKLTRVYRSGKEMRFEFFKGNIMGLHLMLTGDVRLIDGKSPYKSALAEFEFTDGTVFALTDRMRNAFIKLDPEDKAGVDAISPQLNYSYLKKAFQRKAKIKNLLTDQNVIRGIGNSYSDEILWRTGISPFSIANAIPDEKIRELAKVIKDTLKAEIKNISNAQKGNINGEVKDFLQIHTKSKTHSPTGARIRIVEKGMMRTYYTDEQILYTEKVSI